jgi:uncharacterized membrane protein YoaK (UPF0700 family)
MSIEALLWGLLPTVFALVAVVASAWMAHKVRRVIHSVFSVIVVVLDALALWMLFAIFVLGGWPTFLPHVFIGVTVVVVLIQAFLFMRRRHDVA